MKFFAGRPDDSAALRATASSYDTVVTSLRWKTVQPSCADIASGHYDWSELDQAMTTLADLRLKVVGVLKHGPDCTTDHAPTHSPTPKYMDDWRRFAQKAVARYGPNGYFAARPLRAMEVWSEPTNIDWDGSARFYGETFVKVSLAVNRVDGAVKMVSGGPGFGAEPHRFLDKLYHVKGFRAATDQVGAHTYSPSAEVAMDRLRLFAREMARHRDDAPIMITEHGWATCPRPDLARRQPQRKCVGRTKQAEQLGRYVKLLRDSEKVRVSRLMWFGMQDFATEESHEACPASPKDFYGIYDWWGYAKPSQDVWERVTASDLPEKIPENEGYLRPCR